MDFYQNQPITNSCKTILLKTINIFVSAFPGKLIFGTISVQNYIKFNYFQFFAFDLLHLYVTLVNIIKKISSEENIETNCDGVIIKINEELQYLWSISTKTVNSEKQLNVHLVVEFKSNLVYQLVFNLDQLNDFINGLSETIIPCLFLKNIERQFFEFVSKHHISEIVQLSAQNGALLLNDFNLENTLELDTIIETNLIDIVIYYKELIIIYKKIKSLIRPMECDKRIEAILSA